jgi:hypothetical protein
MQHRVLKFTCTLFLCAVTMATNCKRVPASETTSKSSDAILSYAEFTDHLNETVTIRGTYERYNVSKRPDNPIYSERIQLLLNDSIGILLEVDVKGLRTQVEIDRLEGKTVDVTGTISDNCVAWGNGDIASIVAPCITKITDIKLVDE